VTGTIIQAVLYVLAFITVVLLVGSIFLCRQEKKGAATDVHQWLAGLSIVAGSAPYIGLFGTVWHIIQAMSGIGSGAFDIAAISRPIGEALYATLWGLGCAIPALVGHRIVHELLPEEVESEEVIVSESPEAA